MGVLNNDGVQRNITQVARQLAAEMPRIAGPEQYVQISGDGHFIQLGDPTAGSPGPAAAHKRLVETLNAARVTAGKPTLRVLAQQVECSESLLSRVLNGRLLPNRGLLTRLAQTLDVSKPIFISIWLPLWEAANRKGIPTPDKQSQSTSGTQSESGLPAGFECPECGSWVVNPARHISWHAQLGVGTAQVLPLRKIK